MSASAVIAAHARHAVRRADVRQLARAAAADRSLAVVCLISTAFGIGFAALAVLRHRAYHSAAMDFAFFDQIVWNTSQGRWFETSFVPYNFLGQHVEPILLLFAALYRISPAPEWMLLVQGLAAGGAGTLLFLLARGRLQRPWLAVLVSAAFLMSPTLHRAVAFDFHPEVMASLFIFGGLALLDRGHARIGAALLLALLLLKEDTALVLLGLSLPVWLSGWRRIAALLATAGCMWVVLVVGLLMPNVRGEQSDLEARYTQLGSGAGGIASGIVRDPLRAAGFALGSEQRHAIARQVAFQGGLPLLAPPALLGAAPVTALQLLSSHDRQHSLDLQYGAEMLPLVFVATVEGLRRLERTRSRSEHPVRIAAGLLVAGTLLGFWTWSPLPPAPRFDSAVYTRVAEDGALERAVALIPAQASVSAQSGVAAHLSHRERIWEFPVLNDAEYVILDRHGSVARKYRAIYDSEVAALPARGYQVVWSEAGVELYRRAAGTEP